MFSITSNQYYVFTKSLMLLVLEKIGNQVKIWYSTECRFEWNAILFESNNEFSIYVKITRSCEESAKQQQ